MDAIGEHLPLLPSLGSYDQLLLDSLNKEGIAFTSLKKLQFSATDSLLAAASSVKFHLSQQTTNLVQERQCPFLITASSGLSASHPSLFRWGLQQRLLNLIENYQQLPVAYHGVYLRRDLSHPSVSRSRLWHTDIEDDHTVKVLIYLHDVDEQGGPFEYIPVGLSHQLQEHLNLKCGYIPVGQVESLIRPQEWITCTGRAGTVILVDTGMLIHRGKVPQRDRYTIFFDYTSRLPRRPYYCKSSLNPGDLMKMTQNLSSKQRDCVFWRDSLKCTPNSFFKGDCHTAHQPVN